MQDQPVTSRDYPVGIGENCQIIFTLPNGLQGYLLVDGQGKRIDKGPVSIVSDPRRPDRAVENGLSCMSCHARGMIEKTDQVRDHVRNNARAFADKDVETVLALYPAKDKFLALVRADARRFKEAVAKTGAPWSTTEPIVALALRFEAELDLPLAAAEAGVRAADFLKVLDRAPGLAKHLGPLKVEGGTVQRQVFVDVFPELVRELKLGIFLEPKPTAFASWIKRGNERLRKGDPAGAVRAYMEACKLDPGSAFAFHKRASAHHDRGALDQALADYDRAIRLTPQDAVAHNNRGLAYHDKHETDKAIADFTQALRLDSTYAIAHYNRGLAYKRKGELDQALADFNAALRLDRHYALAYHNRAAVHYSQGNYNRAIADYSQVLRLRPKSGIAYNNRGFAYYDQGEYDKALADFSAAIRLNPKHAVAFYNRGLVHHDQRAYDKAITDFSTAIRLNPKFARAYLGRSHSYRVKYETGRADADRAAALRLDPSLEDE